MEGGLRRTPSMKGSVGDLLKHRRKLHACLVLKGSRSTGKLKARESPKKGLPHSLSRKRESHFPAPSVNFAAWLMC